MSGGDFSTLPFQTYNLRHCEFLQLHGFLGLLVVMVCLGTLEAGPEGGSAGSWGRDWALGVEGGVVTMAHS